MQTLSASTFSLMVKQLKNRLGDRYVLTSTEERLAYDCDACLLMKAVPEVVVLPKDTNEVAMVVQLCNHYGIPFTPRGSGTGLTGGALPVEGGVLISLARMNQIVEVNAQTRRATVQAGVVNAWVNQAVHPLGLMFAPDPSSQSASSIGGNMANNAGGIHCVKYGVTTNHVVALEMVLPNGEITWFGNYARRTHGPNITQVMMGSEGTLGVITQAVLQLIPLPQTVRVFLAAFSKTADATQTVSDIIAKGIPTAALEFMDAFTVKAVNNAFHVGFPSESEAVLLVELDGHPLEVDHYDALLKKLFEKNNASQVREATDATERQTLWMARKKSVAAYGRFFPAFYLHDCVVPRSQLTYVLESITQIGKDFDVAVGNVFHAGDGNLHPNILFDPNDKTMVKRALAAGDAILEVCLAVGGTLSGEHGIGLEKCEHLPKLFSPDDLDKMLNVRKVFNPHELANPHKVFPTPPGCGEIHKALRVNQLAHNHTPTGDMWI